MRAGLLSSIVHEWYDPLYRFALSLCRDTEDAQDLTQSAFHKLAVKQESIRDASKIKSWLFSTLHREFIDQYRRRNRFPSSSLEVLPEPVERNVANPERTLDARTMMRAFAQMEEKFRAPLGLFYLESFSYREIADVLDIPIGTVMSRLRRGKDRLRALMEEVPGKDSSRIIELRKELGHG